MIVNAMNLRNMLGVTHTHTHTGIKELLMVRTEGVEITPQMGQLAVGTHTLLPTGKQAMLQPSVVIPNPPCKPMLVSL
jgi:hypothetical protein